MFCIDQKALYYRNEKLKGCTAMKTLDKEWFLKKYGLQNIYKESLIGWNTLSEIYEDYIEPETQRGLEKIGEKVVALLSAQLKGKCHSIESRIKDPEHLIEKVIRKVCAEDNAKYADICKGSYSEIIRDLIGVRVLVFSKENWEDVHDVLCSIFKSKDTAAEKSGYSMEETPKAYIRYGDRDVFRNKIYTQYSNKGYRSQHYVIACEGCYCEIQVRTIAEEVYGEFDHKVRYPYRKDNNFLLRYTTTMAQIMAVADEMVSTCLQMPAELWDACAAAYDQDTYVDWEIRNKAVPVSVDEGDRVSGLPENARALFDNKIFRRKED